MGVRLLLSRFSNTWRSASVSTEISSSTGSRRVPQLACHWKPLVELAPAASNVVRREPTRPPPSGTGCPSTSSRVRKPPFPASAAAVPSFLTMYVKLTVAPGAAVVGQPRASTVRSGRLAGFSVTVIRMVA